LAASGSIELLTTAERIGFLGKDLFVLTHKNAPAVQTTQQHARKNHSFLWIFKKADRVARSRRRA
jgi:hypothetical protein